MTFIADVVTVYASGLAELTLVTYAAFHQDVLLKVFKRSLAYQAFFFHIQRFFSLQKYIFILIIHF
jgi:hypothetical protein